MRDPKEVYEHLMVKVDRASQHISDLNEAVMSFHKSGPYIFSHEDSTGLRQRAFYVRFKKPISPRWAGLIGDALQNLRSALDHLATHLVDIGSEPRVKLPCYPIFESAQKYESGKLRKIGGARPDAIKAIDATEPYVGGKSWALWDLHQLNNRDKHRLLIPVRGGLLSYSFPKSEYEKVLKAVDSGVPGSQSQPWLKMASSSTFLQDGDPLLCMPIEECQENMQFKIGIVFENPDAVKGKQVLPTLENMARIVREIVLDFHVQRLL